MSGNRFRNSRAIPFPMTPTQLTVFTSVCASESNRLPTTTLTIRLGLLEEEMAVDRARKVRHRLRRRPRRRAGAVDAGKQLRRNAVGDEHLSALHRFLPPVGDLVRMPPIFCERTFAINDSEAVGCHGEADVLARRVLV